MQDARSTVGTLVAAAALAITVIAPHSATGTTEGSLDVVSATVRFRSSASNPAATVRLKARYDALAGPSYFQQTGDTAQVTIAGVTYGVTTGDDGVRLGNLSTRLRYERPRSAPRGGLRSLFVDAVEGTVRARIDLPNTDELAATGAWDVPIAITLAGDAFDRTIDMQRTRGRRSTWRHRSKNEGDRPLSFAGRTGFESPLTEARNAVIRDQASWEALWVENGGDLADLPSVDFERDVVIGVFLGDRTGYSVTIDRVRTLDTGVAVVFTEHAPGRFCVVAQVVTQPYALAKIPASAAPVAFRGRLRRHHCRR